MSAAPIPLNVSPTVDVWGDTVGEPVLLAPVGEVPALPVLPAKLLPVPAPAPVLPVKLFPVLPVVDGPVAAAGAGAAAPVLPKFEATKVGDAVELAWTRPK